MNKRGGKYIWVAFVLIIILILMSFFYFALFKPENESLYKERVESGQLVNPVSGLSLEEALEEFDESYIEYLLYEAKAYDLHNPPLSKDLPVIEIVLEDESYYANVENGIIRVYIGNTDDKDIIIETSKEEIVKILNDKNYVSESFSSGNSRIELVESKTTLFSKGYLNLYKELTGKSITGSVIRIYIE